LKSNRFWLIVLGGVVLVCAAIAVLLWWLPYNQAPSGYVRVYKEGELFAERNLLTLTEPQTIDIDGGIDARDKSIGRLNIIEVERNRVRMVESDCLFQICVRQGWVSGGIMPIVCLPNRVVVKFEGAVDNDIDAAVG